MKESNNKLWFIALSVGDFREHIRKLKNQEIALYTEMMLREWELMKRQRYMTEENIREIESERFPYGSFQRYLDKLIKIGIVKVSNINKEIVYSCDIVKQSGEYLHSKTYRNPMDNREIPCNETSNISDLNRKSSEHIDKDKYINKDKDKDNSIDKFKNLSKLLKSVRDK